MSSERSSGEPYEGSIDALEPENTFHGLHLTRRIGEGITFGDGSETVLMNLEETFLLHYAFKVGVKLPKSYEFQPRILRFGQVYRIGRTEIKSLCLPDITSGRFDPGRVRFICAAPAECKIVRNELLGRARL